VAELLYELSKYFDIISFFLRSSDLAKLFFLFGAACNNEFETHTHYN